MYLHFLCAVMASKGRTFFFSLHSEMLILTFRSANMLAMVRQKILKIQDSKFPVSACEVF